MKPHALFATAALVALTLSGGLASAVAPATAQPRSVGDFAAVDIQGYCEVTLVAGSAPGVVVDAPAERQADVVVTVRGNVLEIDCRTPSRGIAGWFSRNSSAPPKITVTFVRLEAIEASGATVIAAPRIETPVLKLDLSGASTVDIGELVARELRIDGSGAVKINVAGRTRMQKVEISGAGDYQARKLASETADLSVSGAGKAIVNASRTLRIDLSGAGIVEYVGTPSVQQSISGLGRVRQVDSRAAPDAPALLRVPPLSSAPVA